MSQLASSRIAAESEYMSVLILRLFSVDRSCRSGMHRPRHDRSTCRINHPIHGSRLKTGCSSKNEPETSIPSVGLCLLQAIGCSQRGSFYGRTSICRDPSLRGDAASVVSIMAKRGVVEPHGGRLCAVEPLIIETANLLGRCYRLAVR